MRTVVCDVGLGNIRSVERAVREAARGRAGEVEVSADPGRLLSADRIIVPGQAAFGDCVRGLSSGLGDAIRAHLAAERPYLGICMGLQVLLASSEEAPDCAGLGILPGKVVKLTGGTDSLTGQPLKIPHMGWNVVDAAEGNSGLLPSSPEHFYFVHSFVVAPTDSKVVAGTTEYGDRFVSAVGYGNVFASQFHPEKSQRAGLQLLERFLAS